MCMYTCIPSRPAFHAPQKNDSRVSCLQQPVMLYLALERVVVLLYATIVQECAKPCGGAEMGGGRGRVTWNTMPARVEKKKKEEVNSGLFFPNLTPRQQWNVWGQVCSQKAVICGGFDSTRCYSRVFTVFFFSKTCNFTGSIYHELLSFIFSTITAS